VVICLTGYLLDWDEILGLHVFRFWGSPNLMALLYGPADPLALRPLIVAGTAAINSFALYLALLGSPGSALPIKGLLSLLFGFGMALSAAPRSRWHRPGAPPS
jgi:hypothetical protein